MGFGLPLLVLLAWGCTPLARGPEPTQSTTMPLPRLSPSITAPPSAAFATPTGPEVVTPGLTPDEIVRIVLTMQGPKLIESTLSPDQSWLAEVYAYDCYEVAGGEEYAYQELRLGEIGAVGSHTADSQLIACGGLGAYGLALRFWSPDSRYLYYTSAAHGVPDGCGWWLPPLARFDRVSGDVENLGTAVVSPDGTLVAAWQGDRLGIWRIDGERIGVVEIPSVARIPGPIAWRPDSSSVGFLITESYCPLGKTELGRLDIADMRPVILLSDRQPSFADVRWDAPNRVTLTDESGAVWRYNLLSRDLRRVSP